MASRQIQTAVYFLFCVALVVVQVSVSFEETNVEDPASASAVEEDICDVNQNPSNTEWSKIKKTKKGVCPKGYYPTCESCEVNTYKPKKGFQTSCIGCKVNFGTVDTGNKKCTKFCKPGRYYNTTEKQCLECPKGTYMPFKCLKTECRKCPTNQTTAKTGSTAIEDCGYWCPAGQQGNSDTGECELCPEGKYKEEEGLAMCSDCGAKTTTLADGATNKTRDCIKLCAEGAWYREEDDSCVKCESGTFKAEPGSRAKCEPCGINKNTEGKGESSCVVECSPGWEPDDKEGCRQCDFGYYKSKSGNINCTQCGMAGPIRRVTEQRESKAKVDCVKMDTCVKDALEHIGNYYASVAAMNENGIISEDAHIVSFMNDMCFDALSVVINQIVDDYRTCEDLNRLSLGDITIGSRTYNGDDQTKLFVEAATHGNGTGHYCHYFTCTSAHLKEFDKCKTIMKEDPENPLEFCSPEWRAGALCTMLNVKNCPPLRYHPEVTEDVHLSGVAAKDIYDAKKIQTLCNNEMASGIVE